MAQVFTFDPDSGRLSALGHGARNSPIYEAEAPEPLSDEDLRTLQAEVIETADLAARKALLQALIGDVRVVSRDEVYPTFDLPAVRPPCGLVSGDEGSRTPTGGGLSALPLPLGYVPRQPP